MASTLTKRATSLFLAPTRNCKIGSSVDRLRIAFSSHIHPRQNSHLDRRRRRKSHYSMLGKSRPRWPAGGLHDFSSQASGYGTDGQDSTTSSSTRTSDEESHSALQTHNNIIEASCNVIDVSDLAEDMRAAVRSYTEQQEQPVKLVGILAEQGLYRGDAEMYSERIAETFINDGISYELCRCEGRSRENVEEAIREMNERYDVHGIVVFYPIFKHLPMQQKLRKTYIRSRTGVYYKTDDDYLRDVVHPEKDVEGLHHNILNMFRARKSERTLNDAYIPCTVLAVTRILDTYAAPMQNLVSNHDKKWMGCTVTIINRSEVLGRPLAALLALQGATVYSVDESSILKFVGSEDSSRPRMRRCNPQETTLETCCAESDIIVTGVPTPNFVLPSDWIPNGATLVNVSEFPNVDPTALPPNVNWCPHVGKVTVAALEENLVRLHKQFQARKGSA